VAFHPCPAQIWERCCNNIRVRATDHEIITSLSIEPTFGDVAVTFKEGEAFGLHIPDGMTYSATEIRLWADETALNEFGFIYVALFIMGSYARYYPDKWLKDVERATPIAHVTEEMLKAASKRAPLLTLSELSACAFVPGSLD
jgi:hypothetical protein